MAEKRATAKNTAAKKGSPAKARVSEAKAKSSSSAAPKKAAPAKATAPKAAAPAPAKAARPTFDFIGTFPLRRPQDNKKAELKKQQTGPNFNAASFVVGSRSSPLSLAQAQEFESTYKSKHLSDSLSLKSLTTTVDQNPSIITNSVPGSLKGLFTKELDEALLLGQIQIAIHDMRDIPVDYNKELTVAAALRREDPRDALVTRSTYGAIQELPFKARVGTSSRRVIMQVRALRPDLDILPVWGTTQERLDKLENGEIDAVIIPWASLRRLNISPRYYVSLQVDQLLPGPCQGIIGVTCKAADNDLVARLRHVEDSEASWASRCERAFLQKLSGGWDSPVGAYAHRKGTQDPWILDTVIGDARTGEILRHREIGTSRCKPESLADKAFTGIISKGARKFLPFG